MTTPGRILPKQTPEGRDLQDLREQVNHLAVEVFHLTTEVEDLRARMRTSRKSVVSHSQSSQPKEQTAASPPRCEIGPSIESDELDLESFRPESRSFQRATHVAGDEPAVAPTVQTMPLDTSARAERRLLPNRKTAARLGGAVGILTLLLVGLLRGGDDPVGEGAPVTTPSVNQVSTAPAPSPATQEQGAVESSGVRTQLGQPDQPDAVMSEIRNEAATDGNAPSGLSVQRSAVGSNVIDRELVGESDTFAIGTPVVFWTHVIGGSSGDSIRHVWFHDGREVGVTVLPVESPSWRTQSRHTLVPGSEGDWIVELQDSDGRTLASHQFRCERPDATSPQFPTSTEARGRRE